MSVTRKLSAAAAATALAAAGLAAVSTNAEAAPTPAKPHAWKSDLFGGNITPAKLDGRKGEQYVVTGEVRWAGTKASEKANAVLHFNAAPADFATCKADSATGGGVLGKGMITWDNLTIDQDESQAKWKVVCTLTRDMKPGDVARDRLTVTNKGAQAAPFGYYEYTVNASATAPKPTPKPTATKPTKDKDSNGGLSKTGV